MAAQCSLELILDNLRAEGRDGLADQIAHVDSAGISVGSSLLYPGGQPANEAMIQTIFGKNRRGNWLAREMENHSSRRVELQDFYDFSILVCVDANTYNQVAAVMQSQPPDAPPINCYLTCLGYFIDEKGKKDWKDIEDPMRVSLKGEKTKMKECWRKTENYMRNWLGDRFGWDRVSL